MQTHSRRTVLAGLAASLVWSRPAAAQDPTMRIIFSFSAGGAADGIARVIADLLRSRLGRVVVVENIVGAGGRIGARVVKYAQPEGTKLLFASNSQMTLQPHIYHDLGYEPFDDFIPVSQTVKSEAAFAVGGTSPVHSIDDLITSFRANPAEALYGSPGIGTGPHFAGLEFARLSGLDLRHAPYKGETDAHRQAI
jgi:tripartite-type tricarboxylate transporter receptor subunit TctC